MAEKYTDKYDRVGNCPECGESQQLIAFERGECTNCKAEISLTSVKGKVEIWDDSSIIITTAPTLENYKIVETIDIISAECVFGMNIFRDFFAGARDFFGGRSKASQKVLRDARKTCLSELKKEADSIGANAVIAVDLDYSEISGKLKSMLFLVASGTAVKVEPIKDKYDGFK